MFGVLMKDFSPSPDCSDILFLNWLFKKAMAEKDTAESRIELLKKSVANRKEGLISHVDFNHRFRS